MRGVALKVHAPAPARGSRRDAGIERGSIDGGVRWCDEGVDDLRLRGDVARGQVDRTIHPGIHGLGGCRASVTASSGDEAEEGDDNGGGKADHG